MKQYSTKVFPKAFTLVELIVVITILAVLGTIAFISFQSYTKSARDVVRTSDLGSISRAITLKVAEGGYAPKPANAVNITASGTVVMYQGEFTKEIGRKYGINGELVDPLDGKNYTYVADKNLFKHELAGFLEGDTAVNADIFSETYAATGRTVVTKGDKLGIVFTLEEVAIQDIMSSGSTLDIINTTDTYKVYFDNSDTVEGTGSTLATINPRANCKRIQEMGYTKRGDQASGIYKINPTGGAEFDAYCDMETDGGGWTLLLNISKGETSFDYTSSYWSDSSVLNDDKFLDNVTSKYQTYNILSGNRFLVKVGETSFQLNANGNTALENAIGGIQDLQWDSGYSNCDARDLAVSNGYEEQMQLQGRHIWKGINIGNGGSNSARFGWIADNTQSDSNMGVTSDSAFGLGVRGNGRNVGAGRLTWANSGCPITDYGITTIDFNGKLFVR